MSLRYHHRRTNSPDIVCILNATQNMHFKKVTWVTKAQLKMDKTLDDKSKSS